MSSTNQIDRWFHPQLLLLHAKVSLSKILNPELKAASSRTSDLIFSLSLDSAWRRTGSSSSSRSEQPISEGLW